MAYYLHFKRMSDLEQPGSQEHQEVQKRIDNFIQYIGRAIEDLGDLRFAENLFRLTVLMSARKDFRLQIERILHERQKATTEPKTKLESSFDFEMSDVLGRTREIPLDKLQEQLQFEFFHIMKGNSVEITRDMPGPTTGETFQKQVRILYKKARKPLPTSANQIMVFARNCGVKVYTKEEFSAIASKISEIEYFGMVLSTDHKLLSLYETNIGAFIVL